MAPPIHLGAWSMLWLPFEIVHNCKLALVHGDPVECPNFVIFTFYCYFKILHISYYCNINCYNETVHKMHTHSPSDIHP